MFFHDPIYMLISLVGMALVFIPQMLVKSTYETFSRVKSEHNLTGAQVAQQILNDNGIHNVRVESTSGELTDHYDPSAKVVRLSQGVYSATSIAALGIAAHEVGHAIQDNRGFLPMRARAAFFPAVQAGQFLGPMLLMAGLGLRMFMGIGGFTDLIALTGILFYASVVIFHIITLPVEFDASFRAVRALANGGYVTQREMGGTQKVLSAAAMTYVATALYSLMELVYWVWTFFGRREE